MYRYLRNLAIALMGGVSILFGILLYEVTEGFFSVISIIAYVAMGIFFISPTIWDELPFALRSRVLYGIARLCARTAEKLSDAVCYCMARSHIYEQAAKIQEEDT